MELAKFMFNFKNQLLPENFNSFFVSVSAIHKYNWYFNIKFQSPLRMRSALQNSFILEKTVSKKVGSLLVAA